MTERPQPIRIALAQIDPTVGDIDGNAAKIAEQIARAHTLNASGAALRNRLELKAAMERFGYRNYHREWWHYDHRVRGARYLDLTLGCEN